MNATSGPDQGHPHNRLSEELRLLLNVLADYGEPWLDRIAGVPPGGQNALPATCEWCPLCATVALIRGERSELAARTAEQMAVLVGRLREVLAEGVARSAGGTGRPSGEAWPGDACAGSERPARIQHIAVRRADDRSDPSEQPSRPSPVPEPSKAEPAVAQPKAGPADGGRVQPIKVRRRDGRED